MYMSSVSLGIAAYCRSLSRGVTHPATTPIAPPISRTGTLQPPPQSQMLAPPTRTMHTVRTSSNSVNYWLNNNYYNLCTYIIEGHFLYFSATVPFTNYGQLLPLPATEDGNAGIPITMWCILILVNATLYTVELPITDPLRSGHLVYNGQTTCS